MRYRRIHERYSVVVAARLPFIEEMWPAARAGLLAYQSAWRPRADLYETGGEIRVTVELAGVDAEEVDVLVFENAVVVEGERRLPAAPDGTYYAAEIPQGRFRLELALPGSIDPEPAEARYERGLLELTLATPRRPRGGDGNGR